MSGDFQFLKLENYNTREIGIYMFSYLFPGKTFSNTRTAAASTICSEFQEKPCTVSTELKKI